MPDIDGQIVLGLDIPVSEKQINDDLDSIIKNIGVKKIPIRADIEKSETLKSVENLMNEIKSRPADIKLRADSIDLSKIQNLRADIRFTANQGSVDAVMQKLNELKVEPKISEKFISHLNNLGLSEVDKLNVKFEQIGDTQEKIATLSYQARKENGDLVSVLTTCDEKGKQISSTFKSLTVDYKQQRAEAELLAKKDEARLAYLMNQEQIIKQIQADFNGNGAQTKAITGETEVKELGKRYSEAVEEINRLRNASGELSATQKANLSVMINGLRDYVTQCRNAQKEAETLAKQDEARTAYLTQLENSLNNYWSKYNGETSAKPIIDDSHLRIVDDLYAQIFGKIQEYKELSGALGQERKNQLQSEIAELERLIKQYQNLEYSATKLRARDVKTISVQQGDKLSKYEETLRSIGLLTQEIEGKINGLRAELSTVTDANGLANYLNGFERLQDEVAALQERIRSVDTLYANLGRASKKVNEIQQKLVGLDPNKDKEKITALQEELRLYQEQELELGAQIRAYEDVLSLSRQKGEYERQSALLAQELQTANAAVADKVRAVDEAMKDTKTDAEGIVAQFERLGTAAPEGLAERVRTMQNLMRQVETSNGMEKVSAYQQLKTAINACNDALKEYQKSEKNDEQSKQIQIRAQTLSNNIQSWMNQNTKATERFGEQLRTLQTQLNDKNLDASGLRTIQAEFANIKSQAKAAGLVTNQFAQSLKNTTLQLLGLSSSVMIIRRLISAIREGINTVVELDTALVDLKKTTTMNGNDLAAFYRDANEAAKELGVTTKDIIQTAADWSRLGFSDKTSAEAMSRMAAQFAAISPGVDIERSTSGLISIMKGFGIEVNDVLDGIMSKVNIIGNTAGVSNADIIDGMEILSASMSAMNQDLDSTIALFTAANEVMQNSNTTATALRNMSLRIRGFDEETEELSEDLVGLTGKIVDLTKTTSNPSGITIFTDASQEHYKNLVDYFRELSAVWDDMSEKSQNEFLNDVFGKRGAQVGAAIIKNFQAAEKAMDNMANSAGNADAEMRVIAESLEYKLNALRETGTGIVQDLFPRESIGEAVDALNSLLNVIGLLTRGLSSLSAAPLLTGGIIGGGILAFVKNLD